MATKKRRILYVDATIQDDITKMNLKINMKTLLPIKKNIMLMI
jgi:hypothetical protein